MSIRIIKDTKEFNTKERWKRSDVFSQEIQFLIEQKRCLEKDIDWMIKQATRIGYSAEVINLAILASEKVQEARNIMDKAVCYDKVGE